ncbi:MAG: C39 family peptidase [Solirubrobacteraceae bacterium]|nr:C39 family peptidase [Solirubrobacteraceae bacterium]
MFSLRRTPAGPASAAAARRRRLIAAALLSIVVGAAVAVGTRDDSSATLAAPAAPRERVIAVYGGQRPLMQIKVPVDRPPERVALRLALTARLTPGTIASRGTARIRYVYDIEATTKRVLEARSDVQRVQAVRTAVSSRIMAPVVRQFARNACEAAALHVLLSTTGVRVSQQRLQATFPRSGPLDPEGSGPQRIWGDPDLGYVGRSDGGGAAGGFGVYPGPVAATARRYGRRLDDLSAGAAARIYARLRAGRAVMAWIGLSDGPYGEWRSPQGKRIKANFGEHTIVLTGISRNGDLRVIDPLEGVLASWSRTRFEAAWRLLGRRALGARA